MKRTLNKFNAYVKGMILAIRPHKYFGWLRQPLLLAHNTLALSEWISSIKGESTLDDFYTAKRNYNKRYKLYQHIIDHFQLKDKAIDYLEFGVCGGYSFQWWKDHCTNGKSRFYGFDTFEGLPEDWGTFKKGDMAAGIPTIDDPRVEFIKGLFQKSVPEFIKQNKIRNQEQIIKILHLDADLFSSTLFALTTLAPFIRKGDILVFDEFNVPNHEFSAFKAFCDSYYIKTKLIGAVNNYYQIALVVE